MKSDQPDKKFITKAPKDTEITIQNDGTYPNLKHYPGDSVDGHKNMEVANAMIAAGEIGQQNENL